MNNPDRVNLHSLSSIIDALADEIARRVAEVITTQKLTSPLPYRLTISEFALVLGTSEQVARRWIRQNRYGIRSKGYVLSERPYRVSPDCLPLFGVPIAQAALRLQPPRQAPAASSLP